MSIEAHMVYGAMPDISADIREIIQQSQSFEPFEGDFTTGAVQLGKEYTRTHLRHDRPVGIICNPVDLCLALAELTVCGKYARNIRAVFIIGRAYIGED